MSTHVSNANNALTERRMKIERVYYTWPDLMDELECTYQDVDKFVKVAGIKVKRLHIKKVHADDLQKIRAAMLLMCKPKKELIMELYHERTKEDIVKEILKTKYL